MYSVSSVLLNSVIFVHWASFLERISIVRVFCKKKVPALICTLQYLPYVCVCVCVCVCVRVCVRESVWERERESVCLVSDDWRVMLRPGGGRWGGARRSSRPMGGAGRSIPKIPLQLSLALSLSHVGLGHLILYIKHTHTHTHREGCAYGCTVHALSTESPGLVCLPMLTH